MQASTRAGADVELSLSGVCKSYGATRATRDVTVAIPSGQIVGLLGANGAGKSTLIKILSGVVRPDEGSITFGGETISGPTWGPAAARLSGVRVVHQELSLCTNLAVYENFYLESPDRGGNPLLLAKRYVPIAAAALDTIFPGHGIDCRRRVEALTIAERQMVEIARAASDPHLRMLILDEPSSSLDRERSRQLSDYLRALAARGVLSFYISHKLAEVVALVTHVLVLRNGQLVWNGAAGDITPDGIIELMGGAEVDPSRYHRRTGDQIRDNAAAVGIARDDPINATGAAISFNKGEVIGFAGLEGSGQREALWKLERLHRESAFVSGDRRRDGVFPLSTVLGNATISAIAGRGLFSRVGRARDEAAAFPWFDRFGLPRERADHNILSLSGGNQQKALMARALATERPVLLLDDPTRGVDIGVKREFYSIIHEITDQNRLVIWNSSEDTEFALCDRVCIFRAGRIRKVISGAEATEKEIVATSFAGVHGEKDDGSPSATTDRSRVLNIMAPASMLAVFGWIAWLNPNVASYGGLDLVLAGSIPLVFAALAQMYMVGGSQIDLGIGSFVALNSVIVAAILVNDPAAGVLALLAALAAYAGSALIVEWGRVPSIISTLGLSFVWLGVGYVIQETPGGSSPEWLTTLLATQPPLVPVPVVVLVVATLAAMFIDRSGLGVALRGFGNNPAAMRDAGWPPARFQILRFLVAGWFGMLGGVFLAGIYTASDINAGAPLTLLSVAALVMGGCALSGGVIGTFGTVCGAVTLGLVAMLLGQLRLPPDYTPMIQGGLLVLVLLLRSLVTGRKAA